MNDELLIPFPIDSDPDYYDLGWPAPHLLTPENGAEVLMEHFEWQKTLVPDLYKDEWWGVNDLQDYQELIARYINYYHADKQLPTDEGLPNTLQIK